MTRQTPMRSPSFCARDFPTCSGSSTARDRSPTGDRRRAPYCLPPRITASASRTSDFAAQWLACRFPLSTLQPAPRGTACMTRGRNDSPHLFRIELSSTISCQLWLAHYPSDSPHPSVPRLPRRVLRSVLSRFASVARSSLGSLVWFMRVCAASRSRLSARGYCRAQGWSYATFMAWRRRLVRELAGAPLRFERRR